MMGGRVDYFFCAGDRRPVAGPRQAGDGAGRSAAPSARRCCPTCRPPRKPAIKGSAYNFWVGLLAPAGTPPAVVDKLNKASQARRSPCPRSRSGWPRSAPIRRRPRRTIRQDGRARAQGKRRAGEGSWHQGAVGEHGDALLQTTVVGTYPQPDWLVNREMLSQGACRARALQEIWRVPEPFLEQAQDDATLLAIRDMERAGIDIITDGEMRRESYSNRFATALEGIDIEHPAEIVNDASARRRRCRASSARSGARGPVEVRDMQFLRANTDQPPRSPCPAPSPWASRRRTSSTRTPRRCAWTTPRR